MFDKMVTEQIKLKATTEHPDYAPGTIYLAAPIYAASDVYRHRAVFATDEDEAPNKEDAATPKRAYKRRDMKAEP